MIDPSTNQLKTVSTPVALGLKSEMTKYEAREKLELEIKRLTGQIAEDGVVRNGSVTFDWFVQNRYLGIGGGKKSSYQSERAARAAASIRSDEFGEGNNNATNRETLCEAGPRSGFGICDKIATKSRKGGASK
ncbi:MAG: hypothetical protein WCA21_17380 [Terracidiphilus sp.]